MTGPLVAVGGDERHRVHVVALALRIPNQRVVGERHDRTVRRTGDRVDLGALATGRDADAALE